ncbi:MAG: SMP-30/gluconolactonase/LRE family protein [Spirochaetales bacterium]|nr:SMP-30/gluconolactonase/LRE family protein [Spirochaetales bacterium]
MNNHKKKVILACLLLILTAIFVSAQSTIVSGASPVVEYNGNLFYEGPVWDQVTQKLYFSTPDHDPHDVYRLDSRGQASIWYANSEAINGMIIGNDGRLLAAVQDARAIMSFKIGVNGPEDPMVLAQNPSWNRPNDLFQTKKGDIFFTGPVWGASFQAVYHMDVNGNVKEIITNMAKPNGVCTSLDDKLLYISDSDRRYWMVYDINADGSVSNGRVFFQTASSRAGVPDGMTMDEFGNLYFTGLGGVWVVSPQGQQLDFISIPTGTSNVAFGGAQGKTLYITGSNYVYSLETTVRGRAFVKDEPPVLLGDVNDDGNVSIVDSLLIAQYYVNIPVEIKQIEAGDVTGCDGVVNIVDALLVAQHYVGLVETFPCE